MTVTCAHAGSHTQTHMQAPAVVKREAGITAVDCLIIPFFQHTFILGRASGRHDCFQRVSSEASFCGILITGVHVWWAVMRCSCGGEQFPLHASCPHSGPPVPVSLLEVSCFIILKHLELMLTLNILKTFCKSWLRPASQHRKRTKFSSEFYPPLVWAHTCE